MSGNRRRSETPARVVPEVRPPTNPKGGALLFRIVGPHQHRAELGGRIFWCQRESSAADGGLVIRWSAFEGTVLLKGGLRTLNDAKKLCRATSSAGTRRPG